MKTRFFKMSALLALGLLFTSGLFAQQTNAIDRYFQQYVEDDRFSVVYISPRVFQLLDKIDLGDVDVDGEEAEIIKDLADDLRGLRILTTDETPRAFYEEAKAKIDTKDYELLMTVRQGKRSNLEFLIHEQSDGVIDELAVLDAVNGRRASSRSLPADLTKREAEVICQMAAGLSNKEIADKLFISAKTVEHHVGHIYDKIGTRTRPGAAMFAVEHGLCSRW